MEKNKESTWPLVLLAIILLTILGMIVFGIYDKITEQDKPYKIITYKVIVASKIEKLETDMYMFPANRDMHTAFYLVYTNGTSQEVSIAKYGSTNVGDTIERYSKVYLSK
jgi:hypothetical protein